MGEGQCGVAGPEVRGLDEAQARRRAEEGQANESAGVKTKSVPRIVAEHTLTLFNAVNVVLAALVASTGSFRNLAFLLVVGANLLIGIVQEVRTKLVVDRLSILARRPVTVRRGGADVKVEPDKVVLGDIIVLGRGDQVPADAEVVWGVAGVNESLLTGEGDAVAKRRGDALLSGSFLDSGLVLARVSAVGADSFAARINVEARRERHVRSEIMATLAMIIRAASVALVPIGAALFARTLADGEALDAAILSTVAALVGMIPQGLVLLTSTVLVISTMRLARRSVLVQQLYCIEMLARVDVLCLDKTGTITSGSMDFVCARPCEGVREAELLDAAAAVMRANGHDANETARAILRHLDARGVEGPDARRAVAFSSARKYSGCVSADGRGWVVGAAQFVLGDRAALVDGLAEGLPDQARILVVCEVGGFGADGLIEGGATPLGIVVLQDHIRSSAPDTIRYFVEQGVTLAVISGDDPRAASAIARAAGVPGADAWVDATTLDTPELVREAAARYHVFGRVTPQQKRELVGALRAAGHTVAMTGDGVNDVLALREADCSVAMASGSDAARNVAEVVLVDDDFSHMPSVVAEGRRSINNLQRSASLFLVKTVFSAALALLCAIVPPYPFDPVHMSLISAAVIGVPSFVLALEPNRERVRGDFLGNVLARSLPASVAIVCVVGAASLLVGPALGLGREELSSLCVILTSVVGFSLIARISRPLNALRRALLCLVALILVAGFTAGRKFFGFCVPTAQLAVAALVLGAVGLALFNLLYDRFVAMASRPGRYRELMRAATSRVGGDARR